MADRAPRVLVVDDERFYREAVADTLAEAGISCEVAEDGESALAAAEKHEFGAVVLDAGLSDPGGCEVLRRLVERQPSLRVVVLATQTEHEQVLEALRLGASDYLAKPLHDEELGLAVQRALASHAVEKRWTQLRARIGALDLRGGRLAERAAECAPEARAAELGDDIAEIVSLVLGAGKAALLLWAPSDNVLRVAAAAGHPTAPDAMDPIAPGEGAVGRAFSEDTPFLIEDFDRDDRFEVRHAVEGDGEGSLVVTPIAGRGGPIGVLCAAEREGGGSFGAQDLALLRVFARQVAALLDPPASEGAAHPAESPGGAAPATAAHPAGDESDSADDAELARAVCEAITTELEPERLIGSALATVAASLRALPVALHLIDNQSGMLVLEGQAEGAGPADRNGLARTGGLTGMVVQTGRLVATGHPEKDPRFEAEIDTPADGSVRPLICVPIKVRGKILGVLRAFPDRPEAARARTAEVLAASVSAAVRNVLLYRSLLDSIDEVARVRRATRGRT